MLYVLILHHIHALTIIYESDMEQSDDFLTSDITGLSGVGWMLPSVSVNGQLISKCRHNVSVASRSRNESDVSGNSKEKAWHGDSYSDCSATTPIKLFRRSSKSMSRHSLKWHGMCPSPITYKNSDNGRRKRCEKLSEFSCFDYSDEETEYESPDEDWFYDPRNKSKWNWENDYCSLASASTDDDSFVEYIPKNCKYYFRHLYD